MTLVTFNSPLTSGRPSGTSVVESILDALRDTAMNLAEVSASYPAVNIFEEPERFRIEVAAPGYKKEQFNIQVDANDVLTLSVNEGKNNVEGESYLRREFANGSFERHFTLGEMIDANKIEATYRDGILTIVIAKKEEAKPQKPRTISIS